MLLLLAHALAAPAAYYHPDDIAAKSALFASAANVMQPRFEAADAQVTRVDMLLDRLELGLGVLGADAPAATVSWADTSRRAFTAQYIGLNRAAGAAQERFSTVFGDALERALPAVTAGKDAKQCTATGMAALVHHSTCVGEDLNPALARALDADTRLAGELAVIDLSAWPGIDTPHAVQPAVPATGTARSIDVAAVLQGLIGPQLKARQDALDADLEQLSEPIEAHDPTAIARGGELKKAYQAKLGKDGAAWRAAIVESLARSAKKSGTGDLAWCANPAELGGCGIPDATEAVLPLLLADKKLQKALSP